VTQMFFNRAVTVSLHLSFIFNQTEAALSIVSGQQWQEQLSGTDDRGECVQSLSRPFD